MQKFTTRVKIERKNSLGVAIVDVYEVTLDALKAVEEIGGKARTNSKKISKECGGALRVKHVGTMRVKHVGTIDAKQDNELSALEHGEAQALREARPMCYPNSNAIIVDAERKDWYQRVIDTMKRLNITDTKKTAKFCDVTGVPD
jgi:hypothetical protein